MKRGAFLSALVALAFGKAAGQGILCLKRQEGKCPTENGECPVCGEIRPTEKAGVCGWKLKPAGDGTVFIGEEIQCDPRSYVTRCHACNAAFWMDTEGGTDAA